MPALPSSSPPLDTGRLPRRLIAAHPGSRKAIDRAAERLAPSRDGLDGWYGDYVKASRERLAIDLDMTALLDPAHTARILDVGSSPPLLLAALVATGWHATGVDIDPERFAAASGELGLEIAACDVEKQQLPFADASFDIVVMNEVFEHLRLDLIATMRSVGRVLAPGGLLCMSTPNARSSRGITNFLARGRTGWCGAADIYGQYEKLHTLGHMGHVREYTLWEITEFLRHLDLTVETVVWRHRDRRWVYRAAATAAPALSPFMSVIVRKGNARPESSGPRRSRGTAARQ